MADLDKSPAPPAAEPTPSASTSGPSVIDSKDAPDSAVRSSPFVSATARLLGCRLHPNGPVDLNTAPETHAFEADRRRPPQSDATPTTASAPAPAWTKHYDSIKTKLPPSISSHIPSSSTAAATVDQVQTRLTALSATSASQLGELQRSGSQRLGKLKENTALVGVQKRLSPDQFLSKAYAIRNDTQIALNVSLNQVRVSE